MAACVLSPPLVVESDDCGAAEGLSLGVCESGWLGWVWLEGEAGAGEVCAISSPDPVSEIKPSNRENRCTFIAGSNWIIQLEGCDFGGGMDDPLTSSKMVGLDRRRRTRTRSNTCRPRATPKLLTSRRRIARLRADWAVIGIGAGTFVAGRLRRRQRPRIECLNLELEARKLPVHPRSSGAVHLTDTSCRCSGAPRCCPQGPNRGAIRDRSSQVRSSARAEPVNDLIFSASAGVAGL
jgi:hypothetical protein